MLMIFLSLIIMSFSAMAATLIDNGTNDYQWGSIHDLTLTMDSGGTTAVAMTTEINGIVISVETKPGTTAPTNSYGLTIVDAKGADILGTAGASRSSTVTQIISPTLGYKSEVPTTGIKTIKVTSNLVKNATVEILIYTRGEKKGLIKW